VRPAAAKCLSSKSSARKQHFGISSRWFCQPCFQHGDSCLGQRCASLFPALFPYSAHQRPCQESRHCAADQSIRIRVSRFAQLPTIRRGRGVRTTLFDQEPPAMRRFQGAPGSGPEGEYGAYWGSRVRVGFERNEMVLRKQRSGRRIGWPSTEDFNFGPRYRDSFPSISSNVS